MTLICQPPVQNAGIVVKESGPKVVKFFLNELNPEQNELTPDTVHSVQFYLGLGQTLKIIAAQSTGKGLQDLPIHFWFSKQPYGMIIPEHWRNLNVISLLSHPTVIYMAESTSYVRPVDPSLITQPVSLYYVNFHNRSGKSTYYQLNIVEET
ncbi:MAG: hypothetical protein HC836_16525 [Richelia sp. RM2_1_2]|nr:hypothetical protein [Richelia sp. RM2_1_2]